MSDTRTPLTKRPPALFEVIFDSLYLCFAQVSGLWILLRAPAAGALGLSALVLGGGDAFHLIPRICAQVTDSMAAHSRSLGVGKCVTSITMTLFYVLLYWFWSRTLRQGVAPSAVLDWAVYLLAGVRILLCLSPRNRWLQPRQPLSWGIIRNVPFTVLGALVAILYGQGFVRETVFSCMPLAIAVSFLCYLAVVLGAGKKPVLGMLMLPKTCAYIWMLVMALRYAFL